MVPLLQDAEEELRSHVNGVPSSVMMVGVWAAYWLLESKIS